MLVKDFMTPDPVTITPDTSHQEAVRIMREQGFRRLPVVDKHGKLVGIVVEKDLLSTQPSPATSLSIWEIHSLLSKLKVREIMSHPVYTIGEDCPIEDAARVMVERKIGCLPVMRGDKLVGIITETDIFKAFTRMLAVGEPGIRLTVRLHRHKGVLAELTKAIKDAGGRIVALATLNEPDGEHKRVAIKVIDSNMDALREAILKHADWELLDIRPGGACPEPELVG